MGLLTLVVRCDQGARLTKWLEIEAHQSIAATEERFKTFEKKQETKPQRFFG